MAPRFILTSNLFGSFHGTSLNSCRLLDEVSPWRVADGHVVRSVGIDCHVGRERDALLVDGGPEVEVFDEGGDVDADLTELRPQRRGRIGHLK